MASYTEFSKSNKKSVDLFPPTDSPKSAVDLFPLTDKGKDINPPRSLQVENVVVLELIK